MNLKMVARYFNDVKYYDAYSNLCLGKGQLDLFDDTRRDGLTVLRRIFEVAPCGLMPDDGVITFHDTQWLVGAKHPDSFKGDVIREKYVLHKAEGLAQVYTFTEILGEHDYVVRPPNPLPPTDPEFGFEAYASRVWTKASAEIEESSDKFNQLQVFFSRSEELKENLIIRLSGHLHIVMVVYDTAAGHRVANVEELDATGVEEATYKTTVMDPVTEAKTTVNTAIPYLALRWQSAYEYFSQMSQTFKRGDMQIVTDTQLVNGDDLELQGVTWKVLASVPFAGEYLNHMRLT